MHALALHHGARAVTSRGCVAQHWCYTKALWLLWLLLGQAMAAITCGKHGQAPCDSSCGVHFSDDPQAHFSWCPTYLVNREGCIQGLQQVSPSANATANPVCLPLLKPPQCGVHGKPCCISPGIGTARASCTAGAACVVHHTTKLPYGGVNHLAQITSSKRGAAQALHDASIMGSCRKLTAADAWQLLGPCGAAARKLGAAAGACPRGSYCASPADHLLGPQPRCLPLPPCGGAMQRCCPPNAMLQTQAGPRHTSSSSSSRQWLPGVGRARSSSSSLSSPLSRSLMGEDAAVPFCTATGAVCFWPGSGPVGQLDQPLQDAYSILGDYGRTLCIPGLGGCGGLDQPCCPHAQFGASNTPMFFRKHICNDGLVCDATIELFGSSGPVLGRCRGAPRACGAVGQRCCERPDSGGWVWPVCMDGQAGYCCNTRTQLCEKCHV